MSVTVVSGGRTHEIAGPVSWPRRVVTEPWSGGYGGCADMSLGEIYRTSPDVRTIIDYLAVNIGQVSLHTYRRVGENDRRRERDHPLARTLASPWPAFTQYDLMVTTVTHVCIYGQSLWLKVAQDDGTVGLLVVHPESATVVETGPSGFPLVWELLREDGTAVRVTRDQVVWHHTPDARSPLEALRPLIAEDQAAVAYREQLWSNGARFSGVITRPAEAPSWKPESRDRFRAEWRAWYTGEGGADSGGTPILEDGMSYEAKGGITAEQAQYLEARKFSLIQKAAAYRVPPPMVGLLDNANYSNVRQLHQSLYTDTLGPWFRQIEQTLQADLIPEFEDTGGLYTEFNVSEKLRGSFEEQSVALQRAVGAPFMTRSEARARMNLAEIPEANGLIVPLNTAVTGEAPAVEPAVPEVEPAEALPSASRSNGHRATTSA
jgi:HK97 family phage portal protein